MPTLTNPEAESLATALGMTGDELAAATGYSIEQLNAMSAEEISALTLTTNNIVWQINEARDGVVIRGCVESARQLTVEGTYGSLPVVEIGDEAFKEDAVLEEIIVPSTVTRIGKRAFRGCVKLKSMR